ncbi:hypothetical protein PoB_000589000 [Plakobranchus ocellatus]|uniref:Inner membrane component domain-containing protein n=1 Tax=Plakobranchus ocellatus TaxID=259542 RepID=A0AAV3Y8D5_9GAST|nr:hypothetical protein PoB_000589000 [Plakobranchus ocellatus]
MTVQDTIQSLIIVRIHVPTNIFARFIGGYSLVALLLPARRVGSVGQCQLFIYCFIVREEKLAQFGLRIWKSRVTTGPVVSSTEIIHHLYDYHIPAVGLQTQVSTLRVSNVLYTLLLGWWLALLYMIVGCLMFLTILGKQYDDSRDDNNSHDVDEDDGDNDYKPFLPMVMYMMIIGNGGEDKDDYDDNFGDDDCDEVDDDGDDDYDDYDDSTTASDDDVDNDYDSDDYDDDDGHEVDDKDANSQNTATFVMMMAILY